MRNMKTKKILTSVCSLAFALSLTAGLGVAVAGVSADNATLQAQAGSFAINQGAAIRTAEPYGIRYTATISKDNYDTIASSYASVEYGLLICPTDLLAGKTLDFDTTDGLVPSDAASGEIEFGYVAATPVLDEKTNVYTIKGALVGIQETNLSRPFTGKAYIKATDAEGNVSYAYTGEESRAIYTVATYAVNDPDEEEKAKLDEVVEGATQTAREYLNTVIDKVQSVYGSPEITVTSSNEETEDYKILNGGDTLTVSGKVSKTVGGVTRTLDACPALTVAGDSGITLEQTSPTEYTVRGINKTGYDVTATIGTGDNKITETALENVTSWQEKVTDEHLGTPWLNATANEALLTYVTEGDFAGSYQWTKRVDGQNSYVGIQPSLTNTFDVGDRFLIDLYATDGLYIATNFNGSNDQFLYNINGGKSGTITKDEAALYSFRTLDPTTGNVITKTLGDCKGEWVTLEITVLADSEDSYLSIFYYEMNTQYVQCSLSNGVYIRDLEVLKYSTESTVTLADGVTIDEGKTYDFLTPINVGNIEVTDARNVTKTLPATATGAYVEDGVLYTGLGEQTIVINAEGFDGGLEYTIQGPTSAAILDGEDTLSNLVLGANASLTYEEVYAKNENAWLAGNKGVDDQYNDPLHASYKHEPSDGFTFTDIVASSMKANSYLYMEVYAPTNFALTCYNNGIQLLYYYQKTGGFTWYLQDGTALDGSVKDATNNQEAPLSNNLYTKQWLTLEFKITTDWNTATDSISSLGQFDGQLRFGKITLSKTKLTSAPVVELNDELSFFDKAYFTQGSEASLVKSTDEGFTDAYKYSVTNDSASNPNKALVTLTANAKTSMIKNGAYMYLTIWRDEGFLLNLQACGDCHYIYGHKDGVNGLTEATYETSGITWRLYVYDENGNPKKATTNGVTGAWMTYEIAFTETSESKASGDFYFFKYTSTGSSIYVKDFVWSATQLTAFANAQ